MSVSFASCERRHFEVEQVEAGARRSSLFRRYFEVHRQDTQVRRF